MTKKTGLGAGFYVDGYNLSSDTGAVGTISGGMTGTQDVTGIDKFAHERLGLIRDAHMAWTSFFNPEEGAAHEALSSLVTTSRIMTFVASQAAVGASAFCMVGKQINYDPQRNQDGSLVIGVSGDSDDFGGEWGVMLTAGEHEDTGAANGSSVDLGTGSKSFGAQAWLHVFAFDGTDATIRIQSSSDDGGGDAFANVTGLAFTEITTAPFSQRLETGRTATIERYLRAVSVTTGGFNSMSYAVIVTRNDSTVNF